METVKFKDIDITDLIWSLTFQEEISNEYIIGNAISTQANITVYNKDNLIDDIVDYPFSINGKMYTAYTQPEKWTRKLELTLYDNMLKFNTAYKTNLDYPTTIAEQLDEIAQSAGVDIETNDLSEEVYHRIVSWYDETKTMRDYLGYIAECDGKNAYIGNDNKVHFKKIGQVPTVFEYSNDYEINELIVISKVCWNDDVTSSIESGDDSHHTLFLNPDNLNINQEDVDRIYKMYSGMSFYSFKSFKTLGKLGITDSFSYDNKIFLALNVKRTVNGGMAKDTLKIDGDFSTKQAQKVVTKANEAAKVRKVQAELDQANNKITIIAKDIDDTKSEVGQLVISSKDITAQLEKITQSVYLIEAGSGNIFDNCEYSLIKTSEDLERATYSIPSLGITENYLKGKDIVISLSVYVLNGYLSLGNRVGVEFDVTYKNDVKKTYSVYWYLGQYDLQYLLQTSTNNVDKRIWAHYKLEDEDIVSVSNLRMIVDVNAEKAVASNPKVEFGTTPTGFEYDMNTIRDNVQVLITQYAGIETTIEKLTARVEKQEQDTISITTNVEGLKKEMDTIGLNVDSMNERVFTNEDSIQAKIIETQNNYSSIVSTIENLTIRTAHTEENVATITQNVTNISSDLTDAKGDISKNTESIGTINGDISSINGSIDTIEGDVSNNKESLNKITATVNQTVEKYTEIESTVNTLSLKAVDQEEKTTTIEKNVNGAIEKIETVESRVNNTEIALQPKNIVLAVNEQLSKDDAISTTSFTLDNKGAHIKNGALDITNASEEKVFYTDDEGNLTVTGNIVGSKITGSAISFKNIENGQSLELNETGIHIDGIQDTGSGGLGIHFKVLGEEDSFLSIDEYGIEIDGSNASTLGSYGGRLSLSTIMVAGNSPIMYSTSDAVWQGVMSDYVNWLKWVPRSNGEYVEITTVNSTRWGISVWLSDARLKQNIVDTSINALDRVNAIRHVDFDWTNKEGHVKCGYIAQELKQIDDEYVIPIEQDDGSVMYQVCNNTITPLLSKAIQELSAKVDVLERRLEENGISY